MYVGTVMEKKLTWEEISRRYDKQWVELVDYDWPEEELYLSLIHI